MEQGVFRAFRQLASRLTRDPQLQKDLMQEMFVHLLELRRGANGQPADWYVRRCEAHAREYLVRLRGTDVEEEKVLEEEVVEVVEVVPQLSITGHLTYNQLELVRLHLSERQQQIFEQLRQGTSIRQIARALGISHPAVIKHRDKITQVMQGLLRGTARHAETEHAALQAA